MAGDYKSASRWGLRFDIVLLVIALLGIGVGGGGLFYNDRLANQHDAWVELSRQLQEESLALGRISDGVGRGLAPDFAELAGQSENFSDLIRVLREGDSDAGIQRMPRSVKAEIDAVDQAFATMRQSLDQLIASEDVVSAGQTGARALESGGAEIAALYADAAGRLLRGAGGNDKIFLAGEQVGRAERLRLLGRRLLGDGRDAGQIAQMIGAEAEALLAGHGQLVGEGPVGSYLGEQSNRIESLFETAQRIAGVGPALDQMQVAAGVLPGEGRNLYSTAIALQDALMPLAGSGEFLRVAILPALGVAVAALILYVILNVFSVRRRIRAAESKDSRQQTAILSLLDEISTLADGDLTVRATVSEEFTGTIADSINQTVDTLLSLVGTINETAVDISAAATSTAETAQAMQHASDSQALEIVEITRQITHSSTSLTAVAARAGQLAQQAGTSVEVAHNGASTVGRTIIGMAALREQIQDTSKRIKRLGESSQEIGNIIEFINDIAEQTNTLALNASIQAAMAGESGRGFAVVADEVQRLAERAGAATRQIETLVKTIQADTNEAIVSMERSTTNVVAGARSAEEAGQALTRIESTSTDLARLIQDISGEARSEAAQATRITGQMQTIREIAVNTASSAQQTASAVGELNALAEKLRQSVAGFTLPTDFSLESGTMESFSSAAGR